MKRENSVFERIEKYPSPEEEVASDDVRPYACHGLGLLCGFGEACECDWSIEDVQSVGQREARDQRVDCGFCVCVFFFFVTEAWCWRVGSDVCV